MQQTRESVPTKIMIKYKAVFFVYQVMEAGVQIVHLIGLFFTKGVFISGQFSLQTRTAPFRS